MNDYYEQPLVVSLSQKASIDPKLTGGKGASLIRFHQVEMDVPVGVVVTTDGI